MKTEKPHNTKPYTEFQDDLDDPYAHLDWIPLKWYETLGLMAISFGAFVALVGLIYWLNYRG